MTAASRRQVVVCAGDQRRLLRTIALPAQLAGRTVGDAELRSLIEADQVGAVVVADDVLGPDLLEWLLARRAAGAVLPVVAVGVATTVDSPLDRTCVDAIVAPAGAHVELLPVVARSLVGRALGAASALLRNVARASDALDAAICATPVRMPPLDSVAAFCEFARRTEKTVQRRFVKLSAGNGGGATVRCEDFVAGPLVLRAVARKRPDRTWDAVALSLGTNERRIARLAVALLGHDRSDLVADPLLAVEEYESRILGPFGVRLSWNGSA